MKHILIKKGLECGMVVAYLLFNLLGTGISANTVSENTVTGIKKEECSFCGTGDDAVLNQVRKLKEDNQGKLERAPGAGLINLNTGEWIDLQLWDTLSGKRGREEIYFGAEDGTTMQFQTMKDRGYTEGTIYLGKNSTDKSKEPEYFCNSCLKQTKGSICEYAFTDCETGMLIPILDNHTFFLLGDYAVHMELKGLPDEIHFLIFFAPEAACWQ